jgi:hypothetical protein
MATKKISEMTSATVLTGVELIPIVQSGANKKATPTVLVTGAEFATVYFTGKTFRIQLRSGMLCIDQTITETGFLGGENTDWENLTTFKREI